MKLAQRVARCLPELYIRLSRLERLAKKVKTRTRAKSNRTKSTPSHFSDMTMMIRLVLQVFLASFFVHHAVSEGYTTLSPQEFFNMKEKVDVVADVRTAAEWNATGHVKGATLVENLASTGSVDDLAGCEYCSIIVYCNSGSRSRRALDKLIAAGFKGSLYNGQGISQWSSAGYSLIKTPSVVPECTTNPDKSEECYRTWLEDQCVPPGMPCDYKTDTCCGSNSVCVNVCLLGKKKVTVDNLKNDEKTKLQFGGGSLRRGYRTGNGDGEGRVLLKGE